jgi:hypothetical protein
MALHVPANCDLNLSIAFLKRAPTPLRHRILGLASRSLAKNWSLV